MMNGIDCDQVFDVLTRAPFHGQGSEEQQVERHLRVCHECRRLAEALRPAVDLFHESLAETETLPRYSGALPATSVPCFARSRKRFPAAAVIAASAVLCTLAWLVGGNGGLCGRAAPAPASIVAVPDAAGMMSLSQLQLPWACRAAADLQAGLPPLLDLAGRHAGEQAAGEFACCTKCHRSGGPGPASERALLALDSACAACHRRTAVDKLVGAKLVELSRRPAEQPFSIFSGDRA